MMSSLVLPFRNLLFRASELRLIDSKEPVLFPPTLCQRDPTFFYEILTLFERSPQLLGNGNEFLAQRSQVILKRFLRELQYAPLVSQRAKGKHEFSSRQEVPVPLAQGGNRGLCAVFARRCN